MSADYAEHLCVIPGLFHKLQNACADRRWAFVEQEAAKLQAAAESLRGYAQARMELPLVCLGPERVE